MSTKAPSTRSFGEAMNNPPYTFSSGPFLLPRNVTLMLVSAALRCGTGRAEKVKPGG